MDHKTCRTWTGEYGYKTLREFEQKNPEAYYAAAVERTHLALARQVLCLAKNKDKAHK